MANEYYTYDPSKYIKDFSWLGRIGDGLAKMTGKFPELVALNKTVKENSRMKEASASATANIIDNLDDADALKIANNMGILGQAPNASPEEVKSLIKQRIPTFTEETSNEDYTKMLALEFYPKLMAVDNPGKIMRVAEMMGGAAGQGFANNPFGQKIYKEQQVKEQEQKKMEAETARVKAGQSVAETLQQGGTQVEGAVAGGLGPEDVLGAGQQDIANKRAEDDLSLKREKARLDALHKKAMQKAKEQERIKQADVDDASKRVTDLSSRLTSLQSRMANVPTDDPEYKQLQKQEKLLEKNLDVAINVESILESMDIGDPITEKEMPQVKTAAINKRMMDTETDLIQSYNRGDFGKGKDAQQAFEEAYREALGREVFFDNGSPVPNFSNLRSFQQIRQSQRDKGSQTSSTNSQSQIDKARSVIANQQAVIDRLGQEKGTRLINEAKRILGQ